MTVATQASRAAADALPAIESLRIAAIDVGSNSIHMVIAQVDGDGGITTLWRMKEMVGLGRMTFPSRKLSSESMDIAANALGRFKQAAEQRQCEKIVAVATSAIREAENGGDFIERCKRDLHLNVKVISARDEARLIYIAARHAMGFRDKPHFVIDIGGGSVEFIVGDEKKAAVLESRKLGAARMTARYVKSDPISKEDKAALLRVYDRELAPLCKLIAAAKPVKTIGTSGTLENLAALCGESSSNGRPTPGIIDRTKLKKLVDLLEKSTSEQRATLRGLDDQRKDQILAGATLTLEIMRRLDVKKIEMCGAALREGILLDYLSRHLPDLEIRKELPDPRRRSVIDLARRCDWNKAHSEHVATLCLKLFDELRPLHHLGPIERELIEFGTLLHDIGWHIGKTDHNRHSAYLIRHGDLQNFTSAEIMTVACIARYHRKSTPKKKHGAYASLSKSHRRIVDVGSALLRLADGLDRSHSTVIGDLRCRIHGKDIKCVLNARADAELEIWGARRKKDWFETVFGAKIEFTLPN